MLAQLLFLLLATGILDVYSKSVPFPFDSCSTHNASDSVVLFCDGPKSIPHRYIVTFRDDAAPDQILTHLKKVNRTLSRGDCSVGDFLSSTCGNCTDAILGPPPSLVDGILTFTRCSHNYSNWRQANRTRPSQCGFNYIYDFNSTFSGYAAALPPNTLKLVLNDPIVRSFFPLQTNSDPG